MLVPVMPIEAGDLVAKPGYTRSEGAGNDTLPTSSTIKKSPTHTC